MSSTSSWEELASVASRLQPADQLRLVERIVHGLATADQASMERPAPLLA